MSMKRFLKIGLLLFLANMSLLSAQRQEANLTIESSHFTPIRLAINQIEIKGQVLPSDSDLVRQIYEVLSDDLDFHFIIDTVMLDPLILRVYEVKEPNPLIWKEMKADHLLDVSAEFSDGKLKLSYSLMNLRMMKETASDSYRQERKYWRFLAHTISDEVVKRLTGFKGIFRTKLAFITAETGNKEIYVSDYDGENIVPITRNGSINISPVWDAKNEAILYTSYKSGRPDLWEVNLESGSHRRIASYPGINSAPAVSPDNREMLLTLSKDGNVEIYLADRKGDIKRRLTNSYSIETAPSFSPSGKELAFTSDRTGTPQIYMMDNEGLNVRRITYDGNQNESPAISPDGTKIAYVTRNGRGNFDICVADITGANPRIITSSGFNENPHWAPDGLHLVYSTQQGERSAIYISDYLGLKRGLIISGKKCSNPYWSGYLY